MDDRSIRLMVDLWIIIPSFTLSLRCQLPVQQSCGQLLLPHVGVTLLCLPHHSGLKFLGAQEAEAHLSSTTLSVRIFLFFVSSLSQQGKITSTFAYIQR